MKNISVKSSLILSLMMLVFASPSIAQNLEGSSRDWTWTKQYDFDASDVETLVFEDIQGNMMITGAATNRVTIIERLNLDNRNKEDARRAAEGVKLKWETKKSELRISSSEDFRFQGGTEYEIIVPRTHSLVLDISAGNVQVESLDSYVVLATGSGSVVVNGVTGPIDIRSGAGNVSLDSVSANVSVNTGAGNVNITNVEASLDVTTGGGKVIVDGVEGHVTVTTAGGSLAVKNVTGNTVLFTSGGDIEVAGVDGDVNMSTSGGDIQVSHVLGRVTARTNGGSITGDFLASQVSVETLAGDIVLRGIRNGLRAIAEVGDIDIFLEDVASGTDGDVVVEGRFGNVEVTLNKNIHAVISAVVSEYGSVSFDDAGRNVELIRERPSSNRDEVRRAEYRIGEGGARITLSTRSGDIRIFQK